MRSFLRSLFSSASSAAPARAGEWQPFALTTAQAARHARWVAQRVYRNWLGPYFKAYHLHRGGAGGGRRGLRAEPLRENGRQGALLFYDESIGPVNFRHLFEHVGERLVAQGYYRACADEGTRHRHGLREHTLKQLFKPPPTDWPDGRCDQRYGLVTLDLVSLNGEPLFLRLAANPVLEPGFAPAAPFEELLRRVFDEPAADAAEQAHRLEYTYL